MVEVEILGHKAKIESIRGEQKLEPWHKEDRLVVWLAFEEAVGSTLSFAIDLPVKKYADREELLYNIRRRGGEALNRILAGDEQRRRETEERNAHQAALDALAAEAKKLIE